MASEDTPFTACLKILEPLDPKHRDQLLAALAAYYGWEVENTDD